MKDKVMLEQDFLEQAIRSLGRPLAASATAALWRCPKCGAQTHALLVVTADAYRCLSGYACSAGAEDWLLTGAEATSEGSLNSEAL